MALDVSAPESGIDAGFVVLAGSTVTPDEARNFANLILSRAAHAEVVAERITERNAEIKAESEIKNQAPARTFDDYDYTGGLVFGRPLGPWAG